jgi:hypothetical protein
MTTLFLALTSAWAADLVGPWTISSADSAVFVSEPDPSLWMNVINEEVDPAAALISRPIIEQGYGNAEPETIVDFGFNDGVLNIPGPDVVMFEAFYETDPGDYAVALDWDGYALELPIASDTFLDSGFVSILYISYTGPFATHIYGREIDFSDWGVPGGGFVFGLRMRTTDPQCDPLGVGWLCEDDDHDSFCNDEDQCPGHDDREDVDGDGVPDGCDPCPDSDGGDADGDGVCDAEDICAGHDDDVDTDGDGTPDG